MNNQIVSNKSFKTILSIIILLAIIFIILFKVNNKKEKNNPKEIEISENDLTSSINDNEVKNDLTYKYTDTISNLKNRIKVLNSEIKKLKAEKKDSIVYRDRIVEKKVPKIVYRDKKEYYTYGKYKGKLLIYMSCEISPGVTEIYVDGKLKGKLKGYYNNSKPYCNSYNDGYVINTVVSNGSHYIEVKNERQSLWGFYINLKENECKYVPLGCEK